MISPILYAASRRLELYGYPKSKIRQLVREIQASDLFGWYDSSVILIEVKKHIPETEADIVKCRALNEILADQIIKEISL